MFVWLKKRGFQLISLVIGLWLTVEFVTYITAESFWFQETGYLQEFWLRQLTRAGLWLLALFVTTGFLIGNLVLSSRFKHPQTTELQRSREANSPLFSSSSPLPLSPSRLTLPWLLPAVFAVGLLIGAILLQYGLVAASYWNWSAGLLGVSRTQFSQLQPEALSQVLRQLPYQPWQLLGVAGVALAVVLVPQLLWAIALLMSLGFGWILSNNWAKFLQFIHATPFSNSDPLFGHNISFYVFRLPVWELLEFWLFGLFFYALLAVTLVYLLSGNSLSEGRFPGFSQQQQRHLHGLGGCLILLVALSHWLSRYRLLYSTSGVTYGAGYTDVKVLLPAYGLLSFLALGLSIYLLARTIFWSGAAKKKIETRKQIPRLPDFQFLPRISRSPSLNQYSRTPYPRPFLFALGLYLILVVVTNIALPPAVQRVLVQPNELGRERPYIQHSINLTRRAFDLTNIEVITFDPEGQLTYADIQANDLTIRNIRVWDQRPLLQTNRQLQQIRLYYKFPDADIDRYTLKADPNRSRGIPPTRSLKQADTGKDNQRVQETQRQPIADSEETEKRQVLLAARELDYTAVPQQAQTWLNKHLIYTHGYGFTLSPVNTVGPGGLPDYFVKDIGVGETTLRTSSERIRASIPIAKPRIYYGEITDTYVMAPTKVKELDYPSGDDNVYNTYDGAGGVPIGSWWRRLLFAKYLNNWQMMLTQNFTPQTKVLFRRNINRRVRTLAPFLRYDKDPYLVVAKGNLDKNRAGTSSATTAGTSQENYLYWIIDAYTTSDRYPYSDPGRYEFNYIRNSVKVVIDAYTGSVNFFIADPQDPIIKTWNSIFPKMFRPLSEMPTSLRSHIRYPVDFFDIQSEQLLNYHMTDSQVFYNREDQWQVPNEIYGNETQPVEPYYLIMKLPTAEFSEFILLNPFTPTSRNNLIAWLAGRSDGQNYGKLLLYQFPKQRLVYGPEQVEARINQDPAISQQISLWNRQGSRAIQGNLLVIPIEQSLLYVEPLYLEAEQNSLPTLVRVIVAYENRIAMAETVEQALEAIFKGEKATTPVILSPGDDATPQLGTPLTPQP
ncbi:UPF0182 family protein [Microcoleus sp. FACHB-68]|uniref:UPF0182 family protein n=1 Tax=Microcoleus sp. FACHB-68 TaxID=2692826 RepID=UPI001684968E|nr:UPF0182 family protein [Microcoleus sp. FACHB-68]MBD1938002.1 UPF0182 family protein [Microcoleus sp. FACHB-68]